MPRFYGRLPARHDPRRMPGLYATAPLPAPPPSCDRRAGIMDWGMMGNDACGDCTIATAGHLVMAMSASSTGTPTVIPDSAIIGSYSSLTGFDPKTGQNDTGCVEQDVLEFWRQRRHRRQPHRRPRRPRPASPVQIRQGVHSSAACAWGSTFPNRPRIRRPRAPRGASPGFPDRGRPRGSDPRPTPRTCFSALRGASSRP